VDSEAWYQFDETEIDAIALAIDAAAQVGGQAHHGLPEDASARLNVQNATDGLRRALAGIFFRELRIEADNPARVRVSLYGDSAAPETVQTYPPSIQGASQNEVQLWRALASAVMHPLPKSLLHDLLFTRRDGDVGLHAREATRLYLEAAATDSVSLSTRVYSALRALTLMKLTSSLSQVGSVSQILQDLIAVELADETASRPGIALPMIAAVVDIAAIEVGSTPVSDVLESVMERYGTADHIDYIADVFRLSSAVSDARKEELRRARVTTRLARARSEEMTELKLFRLEDAASEASKLGYSDLRDEAVADLQQVDTAAMNWVEIGSNIDYPAELVAGYIGEFTSHGDWKRGLRQWLATDVPSGRYADNEAVAKASLEHSVIQNLLTRFRVGTHGMPERRGTADRLLEDKVRDVEYSHALIEGTLLFQALKEIGQLAKHPSEQELSVLFLERYRCPAANAAILAKALLLFWECEYLVCAYFVTPFIEAGVRTMLLELNEPIYRVELGKSKGQYAQLGALLPRLEAEGFDPDWVRFVETITVSDGQNFRNDIAHGFLRQMDPVVATLLLRAAALFLTMSLESATATEMNQLIRRPTPQRPHRNLHRRIREAMTAARRAFRQP
jgi:hypothetical protein